MSIITKLTMTEDVALVTFNKIPNDFRLVAWVFAEFAEKGVDIDMISQPAPQGDTVSISFTMSDYDMGKALEIIGPLSARIKSAKPLVSTGNTKIQLYGAQMPGHCGVASRVYSAVAARGCQVMMTTTSEVDISLLVAKEHQEDAAAALREEFSVSEQ